jgi:hypothetical protein
MREGEETCTGELRRGKYSDIRGRVCPMSPNRNKHRSIEVKSRIDGNRTGIGSQIAKRRGNLIVVKGRSKLKRRRERERERDRERGTTQERREGRKMRKSSVTGNERA